MSSEALYTKSFVSLVGAGPGDPGLLTLRGLERIQQADAIFYDALIPSGIRVQFPPDAECIFVGKRAGRHSTRQDNINAMLIDKAKEGKRIVRLKGGDPFVFGRGGEEALALLKHGIPFEVVPGISSLIGVPAYAGIPVTHRGMSCSLTMVTGHEDASKPESAHDWKKIAQSGDTLVIFMGRDTLRANMLKLREHGIPADRPVALIQRGTWPDQHAVVGTVETIADISESTPYQSPTMFVIGDVVALRESLQWFEKRPLFGKRVLVTRAREQAPELTAQLLEQGAQPLECPLIQFVPPETWEPVDTAIREIDSYHWAIFTSVNGVDYFFKRFFELGHDIRDLGDLRICTIGPATTRHVEALHLKVALQPREFVAEALAAHLAEYAPLQGQRILLPRADIARKNLVTLLENDGAEVTEVTAYQTLPASDVEPAVLDALRNGNIDMVTFASSSTVRSFTELAQQEGFGGRIQNLPVASIGPITSATVRDTGMQVTVEAETYTIPGLVDALVRHFQQS
jgi:uroporphyrinogen III methyltransferase / synthase